MHSEEKAELTAGNAFAALGVSPFLAARLEERNIVEPAPVQREAVPLLLKGESLIFSSATGTGKTLAYLLPVLEALLPQEPGKGAGPRCVIAAPTHELCSQIKQEADFLLGGTGRKACLLIGQANAGRQIDVLKKDRPLLAVGNPARLAGLAESRKLKLNSLEYLVFDEGDRLVSDELIGESSKLVSLVLKDRRAEELKFISCSATFPAKDRERLFSVLGGGFREKVKFLERNENILKEQVEHWALFSGEREKIDVLRSFVNAVSKQKGKGGRFLVFTAKGRQVGNTVSKLRHYKLSAAGLWGDMDKKARKQSMDDFRAGRALMLVTSDLAARGLDIPGIDYVVALDTGDNKDGYIHRAGRTARAGKHGVMVTIGTETELRRLAVLEKQLGIAVYPKELYNGKVIAAGGE